jgi:hypothetical protein
MIPLRDDRDDDALHAMDVGQPGKRDASFHAELGRRFLAWCQGAGIGGRLTWYQLAQLYLCEYVEYTGDVPVTSRDLQRALGMVCRDKRILRIPDSRAESTHRQRRVIRACNWPVVAEESGSPRQTWYELPPAPVSDPA